MQEKILKKIEKIKLKMQEIGHMRPGSLSKQCQRLANDKKKSYYQLSYTYKMKSKTEYIRPEFVKDIKQQVKNYGKFKKLNDELIELSILYSRTLMRKNRT